MLFWHEDKIKNDNKIKKILAEFDSVGNFDLEKASPNNQLMNV